MDACPFLHYPAFAQLQLPIPCRKESVGERRCGFPAQDVVCTTRVCPYFFDVTLATPYNLIRNVDAGCFAERVYEFEHADAITGSEVENFDVVRAFVAEHSPCGVNVSFSEVDHVDKVANTRAVGSVVVVAEHAQFRANADGCLRKIGDKVLRHAVGKFAD